MGLGIRSEDEEVHFWSYSYRAFGAFRSAIAKACGAKLYPKLMENPSIETLMGRNPELIISMKEIRELSREHIGLEMLIYHSDCDGYFTPQECELIVKLIDHSQNEIKELGFEEEQIKEIRDGFEYCFKNKQKAILA